MSFEMESIWATMKGPFYERTMRQLQQSICEAEDLDAALAAALDKVARAAHAEMGSFWFYDRFGDGFIRARAVFGGGNLDGIKLKPGEGVAGQVIAANYASIVQDCQSDPRWAGKVDASTGLRTRSMVCVPLEWKNQAFGCIQIINKTDESEFDETDLAFVASLAQNAARLFREQHLLDDYENGITPAAPSAAGSEPTFTQLFSTEDFDKVTEELRLCRVLTRLSETERKHVLRHVREIWTILKKNDALAPKSAPRRFGR